MDYDLECAIVTKNKRALDDHILSRVPAYKNFEYDHSKKLKVCKHYLMDRCYRDDQCDYAHEIVPSKMPDCKFYESCTDYFCHFKHRDDKQIKAGCADFKRGVEFAECKCKKRGRVQQLCPMYAAGFCPLGPNCELAHPRYDQPINRAEINSQVIAPCKQCGSFHLAVGLGQDNCDYDKWADNSCSVLFKCRDNAPKHIRAQYFYQDREIYMMLRDVLRDMEQDQRSAQQKAKQQK